MKFSVRILSMFSFVFIFFFAMRVCTFFILSFWFVFETQMTIARIGIIKAPTKIYSIYFMPAEYFTQWKKKHTKWSKVKEKASYSVLRLPVFSVFASIFWSHKPKKESGKIPFYFFFCIFETHKISALKFYFIILSLLCFFLSLKGDLVRCMFKVWNQQEWIIATPSLSCTHF